MMVWLAIDGDGKVHGPFQWLAGKGGFVLYAAEKVHPEPWTLVQVDASSWTLTGNLAPVALAELLLAAERLRK